MKIQGQGPCRLLISPRFLKSWLPCWQMGPASSLQRIKRIHWFIKCRITGNCIQILLLSLTPQSENKTKQKAGKNRRSILSWASMIWMLYYQLLAEPQLSRSADFKLPSILLSIRTEKIPEYFPSKESHLPKLTLREGHSLSQSL